MARPIRLLVSDVDGTLVTRDKVLTPASIAAAAALREAGVMLAVVSSRPPRGLDMLVGPLGLTTPRAGFNGGAIVAADGTLLEEHSVPPAAGALAIDFLTAQGVDVWVFAANDWLVADPAGTYVAHERRTVAFDPTVVDGFGDHLAHVGKIVGNTDDFDRLARLELELRRRLDGAAAAQRSQSYYLDINHPAANKGNALRAFARILGVDPAETAAIGDMGNDVPMFEVAGYSVAMGNAPPEVQAKASDVTASNEADGWAQAVERLILPRARASGA